MIISNQQDNEMEHLNKRIQTVAVLGAGAVGCYLIAGLAPKLGENLWIIAEGSRKERLKKEGSDNQRLSAVTLRKNTSGG